MANNAGGLISVIFWKNYYIIQYQEQEKLTDETENQQMRELALQYPRLVVEVMQFGSGKDTYVPPHYDGLGTVEGEH